MTGWINILKGIPRVFIIEEVINKFEDILRCFNWFWSNMKEQGFCICVEVELCLPWNKNSSETFQDQNHAYLTIQLIHWQSTPKGSQTASKFFSNPKRASKGWYCRFETFKNKFSLHVTLIADVIFQFRRDQKLLFSFWNEHQ